jgi:GNAT superfamily N-acetyltransferase
VSHVPLELCRGAGHNHHEIVGLLQSAAEWLRGGNDVHQWAQPWPSEQDRSQRILRDLAEGKTWLLRDHSIAVATITGDSQDSRFWPVERQHEPAVYVRRLVVRRDYAGRRLGAALMDWAGLRALRCYGAQWIRADVWRTNTDLHRYYESQGFEFCGLSSDPGYPSGARFQKSTRLLEEPHPSLFHEV